MEEQEKEKVVKLLPELLKLTNCHVMMIAELESRGVLSFSDKAELESIRNDVERVKLMYEILQKRVNGYNIQHFCLQQTNQTGALKILENNSESLEITTEKYLGAPTSQQYLQARDRVKRSLESYEEISERKRKALSVQEKLIFYNVRNPTKFFTGRVKQLDILKSTFVKGGVKAVISQNSSITGLGGIGKTELAKMFVHSIDFNVQDPQFNTIVWINAESKDSLNRDFKILASDKLQMSTLNADKGELEVSTMLHQIYSRLAPRKTLIVFDNAEDPDILLEYMPPNIIQESRNIAILITSRSSDWDTEHTIRLSGLEEVDAIEFVKIGLDLSSTTLDADLDNQIGKLVTRLEYFPLAISQAIAFIKDRKKTRGNYGPEDYINDLDSKPKVLLTRPASGTGTSYRTTIYQTVELTMDKILDDPFCGADATKLLKLMAYMLPENISEKMFTHHFDEELKLDAALVLLDKFSVIKFLPRQGSEGLQVTIHRLVQEVLRLILASRNEEKDILRESLQLFSRYLNHDTVDHSMCVWKFASKHLDLMIEFYSLPTEIVNVLNDSVRLIDAMSFVSGELDKLDGKFSKENVEPLVTNFQVLLGIIMFNQSRLKECKHYLSKLQTNSTLNENDPIMLNCRRLYAQLLAKFGQFEEALQISIEIYEELIQNTNGKESIRSVRVLHFISQVYHHMKHFEKSIATCKKIIEAADNDQSLNCYGEVAVAKSFLALARSQLGKKQEALAEYKQAYAYAEMHLHPNDGTLLDLGRNLGVCLIYAGKVEEALEVNKKVYESYRKVYGDNHEKSLTTKLNIVKNKALLMGLDDDLVSEAVEVYHGFKRVYGENYYYTWSAYALVGRNFASIGRAEEGRFILLNCLTSELFMQRINAGELAALKYNLAVCLETLGNLEEAFEIQVNLNGGISSQGSGTETANQLMQQVSEAVERLKIKVGGNAKPK